jgi:hypothetical protein
MAHKSRFAASDAVWNDLSASKLESRDKRIQIEAECLLQF